MRPGNRSTVPQGMLAPSGFMETIPDAAVQSTTRPPGTLLSPSAGYDSIRRGKNKFQGKGPTGGFRPSEYAEDIGGTGAALSVVPGDTSAQAASEWIPEGGSIAEGSMIVADRPAKDGAPSFATMLHEAYGTMPDMGDRHPERPLSTSKWLRNPITSFRADLREKPAVTVAATLGLLAIVNIVLRDVERGVSGYRPRGLGSATTGVPAAGASTAGNATKDVTDATAESLDKIGAAADEAVNKITGAADDAVKTIESSVKE